jgi:hypothetical protein
MTRLPKRLKAWSTLDQVGSDRGPVQYPWIAASAIPRLIERTADAGDKLRDGTAFWR